VFLKPETIVTILFRPRKAAMPPRPLYSQMAVFMLKKQKAPVCFPKPGLKPGIGKVCGTALKVKDGFFGRNRPEL